MRIVLRWELPRAVCFLFGHVTMPPALQLQFPVKFFSLWGTFVLVAESTSTKRRIWSRSGAAEKEAESQHHKVQVNFTRRSWHTLLLDACAALVQKLPRRPLGTLLTMSCIGHCLRFTLNLKEKSVQHILQSTVCNSRYISFELYWFCLDTWSTKYSERQYFICWLP